MIIKGGWVVVDYRRNYRDGAVVIEDDKIVDVGPTEEVMRRHSGAGHDKIDARGKIVIPGLVNSHTHISMTLLRGYADDLPLQEWLEKWIWPFEAKLTGGDIELGALLGAVEAIRFGTTSIYTMYHYHPEHNEASGILKAGLRGVIGIAIFSWSRDENIKMFWDALRRWHGRDGIIKVSLGPHAPYTVDPDTWRMIPDIKREAEERYGKIIISTHIAEDWRESQLIRERFNTEVPEDSILKYLERFNILSKDFLGAHAIHLNPIDLEIAKRYDIGLAHNPVANMKLGMGVADTPEMLKKGLRVSLGTDGPASNNTLDMFETMKVAALVNKPLKRDPSVTPANIVFRMATEYGALNLGYTDLGVLKPGYKADIVILDRRRPHLTPIYDIYSHLVYAAKGQDVETVIINGRIIYDNGFINLSIEEIINKVEERVYYLLDKVSKDA